MKAYLTNIAIVGEGMFSSEFQVQYYAHDEKVISGFFDRQFLREGRLEVGLIGRMDEEFFYVMAPQRGFLDVQNALC